MPLPQIPSLFDAIDSVVIVRFAADRHVLHANAGFRRLCPPAVLSAWQRFRQPQLDALARAQPDAQGMVYQGQLTLDEAPGATHTLTGTVFADDKGLLVVAGYDIDALMRHSAQLRELNQRLDAAQRELLRANRELAQSEQASRRISLTDTLTGVGNRRHFDATLAAEVERAWRYGQPLSLVLLDIDNFKRINDNWGHEAGDQALRWVGALLRKTLRSSDSVSRFGGEEFVVLMPGLGRNEAQALAERIRRLLADLPMGKLPGITASFGVASLAPDERGESLFARADAALYRAKAEGRNRVVGWDSADPPSSLERRSIL